MAVFYIRDNALIHRAALKPADLSGLQEKYGRTTSIVKEREKDRRIDRIEYVSSL